MGKLAEYIKLLPKAVKNIDKIIEGHLNNVRLKHGNLSEEKIEIITVRRLICAECPFNSKNAERLGFYKNLLNYEHCIHCGCPIDEKTASFSSNCGIEEYNKIDPENQLSLKW